jgi:uncharacterized membrane protein
MYSKSAVVPIVEREKIRVFVEDDATSNEKPGRTW